MANKNNDSKNLVDKVADKIVDKIAPDENKNPFIEQANQQHAQEKKDRDEQTLKNVAHANIEKAKDKYIRSEINKEQLNETIKRENSEIIKDKTTNSKSEQKKSTEEEASISAKKVGEKVIKPIPNELNNQYVIQGDESKGKYYFKDKPELEAFRDKGAKLITKSTASSVAKSMVALAESKQWETIKLSGSTKFKREVWMEAKLRGMEVDGYKPTKQDLQNLDDRQNKIEHSEKNSTKNNVSKADSENTQVDKKPIKSLDTKQEKSPINRVSNVDENIPEQRKKVWKEEAFVKNEDNKKPDISKTDAKVLDIRNRLDQADKDKVNISKFIPQSIKAAVESQKHIAKEEQAKNANISDPNDNNISKEREKKDELRKAYSELSKQDAIKKFPGLEPLYNLEKAAQQFVEHGSNKDKFDDKGKERFVSKIRENSLDTLSKGQQLPSIKERIVPEKTSEKEAEIAR